MWHNGKYKDDIKFRDFTLNPPQSYAEASALSDEILSKIEEIDVQLGDKTLRDPRHSRYKHRRAYDEWAKNAKFVKAKLSANRRVLRRWMKAERKRLIAEEANICTSDAEDVLRAAYGLIQRLRVNNTALNAYDMAVITAIEACLEV